MPLLIVSFFLAASISFAQKGKDDSELLAQQRALDSLAREVEALKKIKLDRANQLEKAEAIRWQSRYAQNRLTHEYQNETRILEGRYTKASDDLSRMAAELGSLRNLATEQKNKAEAAKNSLDNFYLMIKQAVDKSIDEISMDFPAKMEERLLNFANNPPTIDVFFQDRLGRLFLTGTQEFTAKDTYRLRLGTVFYAEAGQEGNEIKAVLRTGALQGKVFEWQSNLSKELAAEMKQTVLNAQQGADYAWIPMDVLQTKSIIGTSTNASEKTNFERFLDWFKTGGIVMYPLLFVALASVFISLERGFVLWRWGHISKTFTNKLHKLVQSNQIDEAKKLCKKQKTVLGLILGTIVENVENGKERVQKSLQEIILSKQAALEKRMSFLAALGTIAPLLGLLGTVTGMITLFTVITQAGTNDARILAGGISEALITTETGLVIAIPIMLLHGKLSESLDYITTELRVQSLVLLNMFYRE